MDVTRLNLFALCKCLRHAGKVMVLVVAALVGVIWYATVSCAFVPGLQTPATGLRMLWGLGVTMYTALIAMILWSYMATFLTCPGFVPPGWTPTSDEEEGMAGVDPAREHLMLLQKQKQAQQRWQAGGGDAVGLAFLERPRFCKKCQAWKPPRAHHCSMTGRCILKMDHYCVWVLNCVGLLNYKYFVLFLLYTFLGCLASAGLLLKPCIDFFQFNEPQLTRTLLAFISFVFSVAFSLALTGFLVMHLRLIAINQTTIEAYEKQPVRPWPYNRGRQNNFAEVFGRGGWRRLAPFRTREEAQALVGRYLGARYPTESAGQQAQQGEGAETTGEAAGWVGGGRRWSGTLNVERQYLMTVTSNDSEHTL